MTTLTHTAQTLQMRNPVSRLWRFAVAFMKHAAGRWRQQTVRAAEIERSFERERTRQEARFFRVGNRYYWTH